MTQALLYVVATPIGNLADITLRALDALKSVDVIAAEDTRHTAGLLRHFGISKPLLAVHEHNERQSAQQLIAKLKSGESVALVTDAGTPCVSDPGAIVVAEVRAAGFSIVPLPGPSAVVAALSASGIVDNGFTFVGFLPASAGARKKVLQALVAHPYTLVFYEAPHRIVDCVSDMLHVLGAERQIVIARELTKTFETIHAANLAETLTWLQNDANQQRGEFVLLLEAASSKVSGEVPDDARRVLEILLADLPLKQATYLAAEITGIKKNTLYDFALQLKNER